MQMQVHLRMQLYQILNTERYVKSNDDTDIPEIRSKGINCVNLDQKFKKN